MSEALDNNSWWTRQPGYVRDGIIVALLLALALGFYSPIVFGDQALYPSDSVNWRSSVEAMIEYEEETGELALWSPNVFAGMPGYLGRFNPEVPQFDTLMNGFRQIAWPASHLFLMLLGTYILVTYLTRNRFAALVSAVAYGMTTYMPIIVAAGHNTKFVALAYAPLVVLAFVYTLRNPTLLGGLFFAAAMALELRAKHPQITYYILFLIGVWWVVEVVGAYRREEWKPIGRATGWLAMGSVLALLMVAQPYLSIMEYQDYSVRGASTAAAEGEGGGGGGMGWERAMMWSQGPGELVTWLIADAYGGGEQTYWGPKSFTSGPHYIGGVIIFLALLALWRVRTNAVRALGIGGLLMTVFALGKYASWINRPMFEYFPYFDAFRAPETWLSVVALVLAVLGGYGLSYCVGGGPSDDSFDERTRSIFTTGGSVLAVVALLWLSGDAIFSFEKPNEVVQYRQAIADQNQMSPSNPQVQQAAQKYLRQAKQERADMFSSDAFRTFLTVLLGLGLLGLYRYEKIPGWAAALGVLVIVTVDLWGVDRRYLGEEQMTRESDLEQQIAEYGFDTFIKERVDEAGGSGHFRVLPLAMNPMNWAQSSYHYESIGGYHGAKLQIYQDYIDHILFAQGRQQPNENAIDLLSTRYIIARQPLEGTEVVYRDEQTGLVVVENPDALPRALFVGQTEVIEDPEQTWQRLRNPSFDPRETAILSEPVDFETTSIDSASTAEVTLHEFTPRQITWQVRTDAPRLMVASEIYYPAGWNAYVDGEQVPIHRANFLLRAVPVPEGEHTVTMRFEPTSYQAGVWISRISTLFVYGGVVLILGMGWYRRREQIFE
jgi:hypothetical protein